MLGTAVLSSLHSGVVVMSETYLLSSLHSGVVVMSETYLLSSPDTILVWLVWNNSPVFTPPGYRDQSVQRYNNAWSPPYLKYYGHVSSQ